MFGKKESLSENASSVTLLDPGQIVPNPRQPRRHFDEESLIRLADSIRQHGMLQPLCVRKAGHRYELIAGERRLRAAQLLALESVPCLILPGISDEKSSALAMIENMQREDLNMFDQAEAIRHLMRRGQLSQEAVAALLSLSQPAVANKLRLLKLTGGERESILRHHLSERHARALLRLNDSSLRSKVINAVIRQEATVRETEAWVSKLLECPQDTAFLDPPVKAAPPAVGAPHEQHRKLIVKDVRIFVNTIDKALGTIRESGILVRADKTEHDGYVEYAIRIPLNGKSGLPTDHFA